MALSEKTKTTLTRSTIQESDDLYPHDDTIASNPWDTVSRLSDDEVPKTTKDMSNAFKWEHGDVLYGTHAKNNPALRRYREDINKAYGQEGKYKHNEIYVDTLFGSVGEQLKSI